jgi:hypothetical protein
MVLLVLVRTYSPSEGGRRELKTTGLGLPEKLSRLTVALEVLVKVTARVGEAAVPVGLSPKFNSDTEGVGGVPTAVTVAERGTVRLPVSVVMSKRAVMGEPEVGVDGAVNATITVQGLPTANVLGSVLGQVPPERINVELLKPL